MVLKVGLEGWIEMDEETWDGILNDFLSCPAQFQIIKNEVSSKKTCE